MGKTGKMIGHIIGNIVRLYKSDCNHTSGGIVFELF